MKMPGRLFSTIAFVFVVVLLPCISSAGPVPDTGLTACFDNEKEIPCPQTGEPFYGQDGQYICDPQPSYTKLGDYGNALPENATGWYMILDNVTGLIWENKGDTPLDPIHDAYTTYKYWEANDLFIAKLNKEKFGGYSDWRLPKVNELTSIIDWNYYQGSAAVDETYFPYTQPSPYWSSSFYAPEVEATVPSHSWAVWFDTGVSYSLDTNSTVSVRAVRGVEWGSRGDFKDNGDRTVTDKYTSLMWQQDTAPDRINNRTVYYNWQEALSYCENLTLAGYSDWRLPNVNELQSLVDYTSYNPSINEVYFPITPSVSFWSSTTDVVWAAWNVSFYDGSVSGSGSDKLNPYNYVRCVRGGQCSQAKTTTTTVGATTSTVSLSSTTTVSGSTTTTTANSCLVEEVYGQRAEETELLRNFRDNVLSQTPAGREMIRLYYEWSPTIIKEMRGDEALRAQMKKTLDNVCRSLKRNL